MAARKLPYGLSSARSLFARYRYTAKKSGRAWEIPFESFLALTSGNCYLCGSAPGQVFAVTSRRNGPYTYNGLDRIDNTKGYILSNVMPCCKLCNTIKGTQSLPDIFDHMEKILAKRA